MESEPPSIDDTEVGACNSIPVGFSILCGWDGKVLGLSADRPSGLSDPDRLSSNSSLYRELVSNSDLLKQLRDRKNSTFMDHG